MQHQKKGVIVIILSIITFLMIGGAIGYLVTKEPVTETVQKSQDQLQQQYQQTQQITKDDITADWKTYRNERYGFQILLTEKWENYRITEEPDPYNSVIIYLRFKIPTADKIWEGGNGWYNPFVLAVYPKTEWQKLEQEEGPKPTYIAENNTYVFAYSRAQDAPKDFWDVDLEIPKIISTFKLIR